MKKLLTTLALSTATFLSAVSMPCLDGCVELSVETLYWRPCTPAYHFGERGSIPADPTLNIRRQLYDHMGLENGVRVFGQWNQKCGTNFARVDWTYFDQSFTDRRTGPFLLAFYVDDDPVNASYARARVNLRYNRVNARVGRTLACVCNSRFYGFGGISYVDMEQKRHLRVVTEEAAPEDNRLVRIDEKSSFSGGAFEVGIGGQYAAWCGLGVRAEFGLLTAIGEKKNQFRRESELVTGGEELLTLIPQEKVTACVPGIEFTLGLNYTFCTCGVKLLVEGGYTGDYYFRPLDMRRPTINPSSSQPTNLGFSGPYARASVTF